MTDKVVAYSPNRARLTRIVSEQASAGNQVMAAFLNLESAQAHSARFPYRLVGEPTGSAGPAVLDAPAFPAPSFEPSPMPDAPSDGTGGFPAPGPMGSPMASPMETPLAPTPPAQSSMPSMPVLSAPGQLDAVQPRKSGGKGQVFACYSPRGGSGTSLLAAALASKIAQDASLRVLLVDLDLQNGSQSYFFDVTEMKRSSVLGLKPLVDEILVRAEGKMERVPAEAGAVISEEILLNKCYRKDNLYILCALDDPAAIDDYADPSTHMEALVQILANNFDVVVLDLPNTVDMFTAPALFQSDRILVVTPDDIPSQIKVARMLNLVLGPMIEARDLRVQDRCFLVVNRSSKKKLEVPMPVAVAATIPDDKKFMEGFVEKHEPYAKVASSGVGKAVAGLATFLGVGGAAGKK
ncbi:MAG: AAA family ATPase [Candidatus Dormibacteria bacterium]